MGAMVRPTLVTVARARAALPEPPVRRALREGVGASQGAVGRESGGVTATAVGHWEAGRRTPRGEHLVLYVELLAQFEMALRGEE